MGAGPSRPSEQQVARLCRDMDAVYGEAARLISQADILLLCTGAGFSADSGLAVYADVAKLPAYAKRELEYHDICKPHWLGKEPGLFWGFWGQCYNDYRDTAPHDGYEIINDWVERRYRHSAIAANVRNRLIEQTARTSGEHSVDDKQECPPEDSGEIEPYTITDHAGAFFVFTSNVDAHHFDWFRASEIRECHGNTELYQCGKAGRNAACKGIWRAPDHFRFEVNKDTMIAPVSAPSLPDAEHVPSGLPLQAEDSGALSSLEIPRIGKVCGQRRTTTLRYMTQSPASFSVRGFEQNHPLCQICGGPARPAILMFDDYSWQDLDQQSKRYNQWIEAAQMEVKEQEGTPVRVVILEIGAGGNVTTVRNTSEMHLDNFLDVGADAKLIRVNPYLPLGDATEFAPGGQKESCVLSVMARGLEAIRKIDVAMAVS